MNAAAARQRSGSFLPDISKRKRSARHRLKTDSLQTGPASDEPAQTLTKDEIARFRNSVRQNICVEMLREGYHRSFSELFSLLRSEEERRAAAEPGSAPVLQTPLAEQQEKLETIRLHLCRAEQAARTGSWSVVCEQRLLLGLHFSAPEDLFLRLHFCHSCADTEHGAHTRPATEARACIAELCLRRGDLEQAKQQAEMCLAQADAGGWLDLAGQPLRLRARQALWRIYVRLAEAPLAASDYNQALALLRRGYSIAVESEDKHIEGEAAYQLGLAYQCTGDHDSAKKLFNASMQICGTLQDADGLGKTYKAMAKSLESERNVDGAVQCLEELAHISLSNRIHHNLADAYLCLGKIYYTVHQYKRASECFLQGSEVACHMGDEALLQKARVWTASARAHCMVREYSADVEAAAPAALRRLVAWKESRRRQDLSTDATDDTAADWQ